MATLALWLALLVVMTPAADAASLGSRTLRPGASGEDVAALQDFLNRIGHPAGQVDGIFGPRTQSAVAGFQGSRGLVPDGIVGARTFEAINRLMLSEKRPLAAVLRERGVPVPIPDLKVVVDKSDHTLSLYAGHIWLKSYPVDLGEGGLGDKEVQGDRKTPEGTFYVTEKTVLSPSDPYLGSRWLRLSYPNAEDAERGLRTGLIDASTYEAIVQAVSQLATPPQQTALGGGIGIHGGSVPAFGPDWTWGCIALTNRDVEELYEYVPVGTTVIVRR
ncbi:MAG: murein L,D-transpeptidase [Clostridia bacterium]|nr:murein L,D-transpeptidase [Clostridia bacterium]